MNPNFGICHLRNLMATYPKHLPLQYLVGHVLVGVLPCGRCIVVASLLQIAKPPKKSQNNGFNTCELI